MPVSMEYAALASLKINIRSYTAYAGIYGIYTARASWSRKSNIRSYTAYAGIYVVYAALASRKNVAPIFAPWVEWLRLTPCGHSLC